MALRAVRAADRGRSWLREMDPAPGRWGDAPAAVAVDAPAHGQGRLLAHPLHPFDGPVAILADDPGEHVLAVVEVNEVGQIVDLGPADRPPLRHRLLELLDLDRFDVQPGVAVHADVLG